MCVCVERMHRNYANKDGRCYETRSEIEAVAFGPVLREAM